jgi:hypothetical protein
VINVSLVSESSVVDLSNMETGSTKFRYGSNSKVMLVEVRMSCGRKLLKQ